MPPASVDRITLTGSREIKVWAEAHMDEVLTNREEQDNRAP
jgi:hypothetical protein